jgi:Zn ribbon nucleic-acid-binding protein
MGSIVDYIECPNCKTEDIMNEFWYKTAEESIFCSKCGYSKKAFIKNRDKKLTELTDEDWDMGEVKNPYGAFRMLGTDNNWIAGTLETEEDLLMMQNKIQEENLVNIKKFIVSRFIDGEIKEIELIV